MKKYSQFILDIKNNNKSNQLHAVSRSQPGRQREPSVPLIRYKKMFIKVSALYLPLYKNIILQIILIKGGQKHKVLR